MKKSAKTLIKIVDYYRLDSQFRLSSYNPMETLLGMEKKGVLLIDREELFSLQGPCDITRGKIIIGEGDGHDRITLIWLGKTEIFFGRVRAMSERKKEDEYLYHISRYNSVYVILRKEMSFSVTKAFLFDQIGNRLSDFCEIKYQWENQEKVQ